MAVSFWLSIVEWPAWQGRRSLTSELISTVPADLSRQKREVSEMPKSKDANPATANAVREIRELIENWVIRRDAAL